MSFADTLSYFTALVAIAIAPGPVVLMLMVRAASNDAKGATGFGFGFAAGGLLIITAVCFGLGAWLTSVPEVFEYSKYVMLAYFIFLAHGIWKGGFDMNASIETTDRSTWSSVLAGLFTCFISPYMMILFPLVLPEMMDITAIQLPDFAVVAALTFLALASGAAIIIIFAAQIRRLVRSPRAMIIMNRSLAISLVSVGGWMTFA